MANRWSAFTDKIRNGLPHWWKLRRDKKAKGADFLNVMGLTLEDIQDALDYAMSQYYIGDADIQQVDIVYKTSLPYDITQQTTVEFRGLGYTLEKVTSLNTFLTALPTDELSYPEIFYNNPYYIDWNTRTLYVRKPYEVNATYPEGSIIMDVFDDQRRLVKEETLRLHLHHVWNFFDEFGLLLDTPRLYGERNEQYVKRILDVFRHPANSTYLGLLNGIARELSLTREENWADGSQDYIINHPRVVLESIEVDGKKVDTSTITIDDSGRTILAGDPALAGVSRKVTYVSGLDIHQLYDKTDYAFQDTLYTPEGTATPLLQHYVDIITSHIPVLWGKFVFGAAYWDIATSDMSGIGFMPSLLDAKFANWQTYVPKR